MSKGLLKSKSLLLMLLMHAGRASLSREASCLHRTNNAQAILPQAALLAERQHCMKYVSIGRQPSGRQLMVQGHGLSILLSLPACLDQHRVGDEVWLEVRPGIRSRHLCEELRTSLPICVTTVDFCGHRTGRAETTTAAASLHVAQLLRTAVRDEQSCSDLACDDLSIESPSFTMLRVAQATVNAAAEQQSNKPPGCGQLHVRACMACSHSPALPKACMRRLTATVLSFTPRASKSWASCTGSCQPFSACTAKLGHAGSAGGPCKSVRGDVPACIATLLR